MGILSACLFWFLILFPAEGVSEKENEFSSIVSSIKDSHQPKQWRLAPPDSVNLKPRVVNFNIMVAGLSGLGKTTFCRALLDSWTESAADSSTTESKSSKRRNGIKDGSITTQTTTVQESSALEWYDDTANTLLRVRIIDTPGFGNKVNHKNSVQVIRRYIQSCRKEQMHQELSSQPTTAPFRAKQEERLVHVCLYFLSPGRFLEIDRHFLKHVQHELPIVPIIAKADTLTDDEISEYRGLLKETFQNEGIKVYDFDTVETDSWEPKKVTTRLFRWAKRQGISHSGGMYSWNNKSNTDGDVDSSDVRLIKAVLKKTTLQNRNFRGRKKGEALAIIGRDGIYPWGEAQSFDPLHSDLRLIRDLLLSEHTERFLEQSQIQYQQYRTRCIAQGKVASRTRQSAFLCLLALQLAATLKLDFGIQKVLSFVFKLLPSVRLRFEKEKGDDTSMTDKMEETENPAILFQANVVEPSDQDVDKSVKQRNRWEMGLFGTPGYNRNFGL